MTILEAINQIDGLKPNTFGTRQKVLWLSQLEAIIKRQVIDAYEGGEEIPFEGFDDNTDLNTVLIMTAPFDMGYIYWLEAQIHYAYEELDMYNAAITMFNTSFREYKADYARSHKAKGRGRFRF